MIKTMSENVNFEKSGVFKSHAERLSQALKEYPKTLCSDYEVRASEDVVVNGRILKKSCSRVVHPQDIFKGLSALDFALENIISVGALDSLKECKLNINTCSELSDSLECMMDNVIPAVDSANLPSVEPNSNEGD